MENNIILKARTFAIAAHAAVGQKRKYTGEPYIVHPIEVAAIVATVPHDPNMLAAALLHDVVEDTKVALDLIFSEFGADIAMLVMGLTDSSKPEDGNRKTRKAIECARLGRECARVQTIKLADLISNTSSIVTHDPKFARVYLAEKSLLLSVMTKGDGALLQRAYNILNSSYAELEICHE